MSTKINYRVNDRVTIQVEANGPIDMMEQIGHYVMILSQNTCGLCQSSNVHPEHAARSGYDFYSMRCFDCGGEFSFGQHKEGGTLFPKTDKGWHKFQADNNEAPY